MVFQFARRFAYHLGGGRMIGDGQPGLMQVEFAPRPTGRKEAIQFFIARISIGSTDGGLASTSSSLS